MILKIMPEILIEVLNHEDETELSRKIIRGNLWNVQDHCENLQDPSQIFKFLVKASNVENVNGINLSPLWLQYSTLDFEEGGTS